MEEVKQKKKSVSERVRFLVKRGVTMFLICEDAGFGGLKDRKPEFFFCLSQGSF